MPLLNKQLFWIAKSIATIHYVHLSLVKAAMPMSRVLPCTKRLTISRFDTIGGKVPWLKIAQLI